MPGRTRPSPASIVLVALLALGGCQGRDDHHEAPPSGRVDAQPVAGGTAVIALADEPDVMNSLIRSSAVAGQVLSLVQAGLAEMGEDLEWGPMIASSWSVAPDSLAITYHLRPWSWSDGVPLTARDVVSSYELLMDPRVASPRAGQFRVVARVVEVDSATVRFELKHPVPRPVEKTVYAILPWHVTRDLAAADVAHWPLNQHPLASGPFMLETWERGRQLTLVPNPAYPLPHPWLDRVIMRVLPDETARVLALETGEVDVVADLTASAAQRLTQDPDVTIYQIPGRALTFIIWNLRRGVCADVRVRRALSLAIDRDRLVHDVLQGFGQPAASLLPPSLWNHDATVASDPYDPAEARRLLAEAGWEDHDGDGRVDRDGKPLRLEMMVKGGDPVSEETAALVRTYLGAVGVEVRPRRLELATMIAALQEGSFDAALVEFNANLYGDPSELVRTDAQDRFNFGGYSNARVDSLLTVALRESDRERARPLWHEIQTELAADPPDVLLYYPTTLMAVSARIQGVRPHLLSPYNNLQDWWIPPSARRYRSR